MTNNDARSTIEPMFTDNAAWRGAITAVKDGAVTPVVETNYQR